MNSSRIVTGLLIALVAAMGLSVTAQAATVAYWRFETGPAGTNVLRPDGISGYTFTPDVLDVSGNGNHLAAWSTGGGTGFAYRDDVPLAALPQTNAANHFSVQNTGSWPALYTKSETSAPAGIDIEGENTFAQFTLEAFYKTTATGGHRTIIGRDGRNVSSESPDRAALYFQVQPNNNIVIQFADVTGNWHFAGSADGVVQANRWYYYAAISDGATLSLYMADIQGDGELTRVAQTNMTASANTALAKGTTSGDGWHAGGWSVGRGLWAGGHTDRAFGFIDEVRISNSALPVNQLLYSQGTSAWEPDPADGATGVDLNATLSWLTGRDPLDFEQYNAAITHHYVYFRSDPNFLEMTAPTAIVPANGPAASYTPSGLKHDKTYYWRVDEILNNGPAGDPNKVIEGGVWTFSTILSAPTIKANGHPKSVIAAAGTDAAFELFFTSFSPSYVRWYLYVDGENDIALTNEFGMSLNASKYAVDNDMLTEASLVINNAAVSDEGYYYAVVANGEGLQVQSNTARLVLPRRVVHLPMDTLVGGVTPDSEDGYHLTLQNDVLTSNLATLADGVDELGGGSLLLGNTVSTDPNFYGQYGMLSPGAVHYEDITVSVWVHWNGGGNWQRIFDFGNDTGSYMMLTPSHGSQCRFVMRLNNGTEQITSTSPLPINEWVHVTVTLNGNTARIYVNGELRATNTAVTINPVDFKPALNYIGKSQYPDPYFNGRLDDLMIYNYARTTEQIAEDYLDVRGEWVCNRELTALTYDFNGDCRVDLGDFAILAGHWLDSNRIYPR